MSLLTEEQKATAQKRVANTEMKTTTTTTNRESQTSVSNPFARQLHQRAKGQYRSPSITTDKHIMQHEEAIDFERHRWQAIVEARTEWHPEF